MIAALGGFAVGVFFWIVTLGLFGWIGHVLVAIEAAVWNGD